MKILLIIPTFNYRKDFPSFLSLSDFPSGFGYLASSLKEAGHEVHGLNLNNDMTYKTAYEMLRNRILQALDAVKPELIGLGGLCIDYHFLRDAIEIIRAIEPRIPIVMGGGIVNNDAEYIFNDLKPDFAVVGEGEEIIVKLANLLQNEVKPANYNLPNLWYWHNGEATFTRVQYDYRPLDERPFPDYEPFGVQEMMDKYSASTRVLYRYSRPEPRPFIIVTARSCPFKCTFCVHNHGPKYRARSVPNIIEEIKQTYHRYHYNILLMLDELFAVNKERMKEFCLALIEAKEKYGWDFDWTFQTHASASFDKEALELAKRSGCYMFSYGLESASPIILESMNKKTKIEQVIEAIELAKEAKIGFSGNLIFGDPAETDETMAESLSFWLKYCRGAFVFLSYITPYPGSKVFDDCVERGIIRDKANYYENIDNVMVNMTSMNMEDWKYRLQAALMLEHSWLFVQSTQGRCEKEDGTNMYKIKALCPYCKEEVLYREYIPPDVGNTFLGLGCTKCQQKIRIDIAGHNRRN